jgi:hypothetical protein
VEQQVAVHRDVGLRGSLTLTEQEAIVSEALIARARELLGNIHKRPGMYAQTQEALMALVSGIVQMADPTFTAVNDFYEKHLGHEPGTLRDDTEDAWARTVVEDALARPAFTGTAGLDVRDDLMAYLDQRLASMDRAPGSWGSPESLEMQALLLLEIRTYVCRRTTYDTNPFETRNAYLRFVAREFPASKNTLMSSALGERASDDLPALIKKMREEIVAKLPPEDALARPAPLGAIERRVGTRPASGLGSASPRFELRTKCCDMFLDADEDEQKIERNAARHKLSPEKLVIVHLGPPKP